MAHLDSKNLLVFTAVADELSFSTAASRLNLTQSAVSKRIALLEDELGQALFERHKRSIQLTEAGRTLLPRALNIINEIRDARQEVLDMGETVEGRLSIAISHHVGLHRLPGTLKKFRSDFPLVKLDIQFVDSDNGYKKVIDGSVELSVITLKSGNYSELSVSQLWRDPLIFVCSPEHELHLQDNVTLEQLSKLDAILPSQEMHTRRIIDEIFLQQQLTPTLAMSTNYLETIKIMVSIGLGWSVLPRSMMDGLEEIHVPDTYLERTLGIVKHNGRKLSRAATEFERLLLPGC